MKLPNSYGSVTKLSGKRRNPYMARVTTGCVYNEAKDEYIQQRKAIGYFHTRAEALEALAKYNENPYTILNGSLPLKTIWEDAKLHCKASEERMKVYERLVTNYLDPIINMKIMDIKTTHLQKIVDDCEKGYSTKSNLRALFHVIFKYACQNDIVEKDYADYLILEAEQATIERRVYTKEEIDSMWSKSTIDEYAMTLILLYEGMRLKEFRDLRKEYVDYDAMTITIPKAKNSYSVRTIPIHEKALPLLKQLEKEDGSYTKMTARTYEYFVGQVFSNHTAYDCRHTFATKANEIGIPILHIQRIMGHKPDALVHQVYTHLTIEELKESIDKIQY